MGGIAEVLSTWLRVQGSDLKAKPVTAHLERSARASGLGHSRRQRGRRRTWS